MISKTQFNQLLLSPAIADVNTGGLLPYGQLDHSVASIAIAKSILLCLNAKVTDLSAEAMTDIASAYDDSIGKRVSLVADTLAAVLAVDPRSIRTYAKEIFLSAAARGLVRFPLTVGVSNEQTVMEFLGIHGHLSKGTAKAIADNPAEINRITKPLMAFIKGVLEIIDNS